ncbi:MAG: hypothetical protein GF390_00335 [Candidatus Pacebacteria bacterium]|nr:hypothetical protein [Candidatus Paceibacterota bacterium]
MPKKAKKTKKSSKDQVASKKKSQRKRKTDETKASFKEKLVGPILLIITLLVSYVIWLVYKGK